MTPGVSVSVSQLDCTRGELIGIYLLMIRRVQVHSIPATGKEYLGSKSIRTVVVGEAVCLRSVGSQTIEGYCLLRLCVGIIAQIWITSKHLEAFWECKQSILILRVLFIFTLPILLALALGID